MGTIEERGTEKDKKEKVKRWAAAENKSFIKRMFRKIASFGEDKNVDILQEEQKTADEDFERQVFPSLFQLLTFKHHCSPHWLLPTVKKISRSFGSGLALLGSWVRIKQM